MLKALRPTKMYRFTRNQLGSVRQIYLAGNRVERRDDFGDDSDHSKTPVLLIQGYMQTRNVWNPMEQRLRAAGHPVMSFNLGGFLRLFNTHRVDRSAAFVADKLARMQVRFGFEGVHIIGHSKGGLIARRFIQHHGGADLVRSLTTLGTPHAGAPLAAIMVPFPGLGIRSSVLDLLPGSTVLREINGARFPGHIPLLSVYSNLDLLCPDKSAQSVPDAPLARSVHVEGLGHSELVWDPTVHTTVLEHIAAAERRFKTVSGLKRA